MNKRIFARLPILILCAVLLLPFLPILVARGGRIIGYPGCDSLMMFYPINNFAGHCWRQGVVPLWNPHVMLGIPFLGEGQAAIFHPLSWLFIFLPTGAALNWLDAISFVLMGLFFYGYLRSLKLSRDTAVLGSLVWCFSNVMVMRFYAGHVTNLLEFIEMPLMLMFWERYRADGRIGGLIGIAVTYGLMLLGSHPQFLYIFSLFFMLYVLLGSALACVGGGAAVKEGRAIGMLGVFVVLGIGVGAIQLIPAADFAAESFRRRASFEFCGSYSFPPENLLTLLVPRFFGMQLGNVAGQYWGRDYFWEMCVYIGVLPLLLAFAGLLAAPRRRAAVLAGCCGVFLVIALGRFTPAFRFIYDYVPFFNTFRGPSKNILMSELCLATLSAYGLEALLHPANAECGMRNAELGNAKRRKGLLAAALAAGGLLILALGLYVHYIPGNAEAGSNWQKMMLWIKAESGGGLTSENSRTAASWAGRELARAMVFLVLSLGVVALAWSGKWRKALLPAAAAVILADLLWFFLPLFRVTYDEGMLKIPAELMAPLKKYIYLPRVFDPVFMYNSAVVNGFSGPNGYTGNNLDRYNLFINSVAGAPPETAQVVNPGQAYNPLFRFFSYDAAILPDNNVQKNMKVLARAEGLSLIDFPEPFPRAFLAASPQTLGAAADALRYVQTPGVNLALSPAIEGAIKTAAAPLEPSETVKFVAYAPSRVELEVHAAHPRVLVLNDMFEKSWTARVGETPARILPANYLFRGVEVPAGTSRVVFEYRPASLRWGAAVTLIALAALAGIGVAARKKEKEEGKDKDKDKEKGKEKRGFLNSEFKNSEFKNSEERSQKSEDVGGQESRKRTRGRRTR